MFVYVNGEKKEISDNFTLGDFLKSQEIEFESVVVELNGEIIETEDYQKTILKENDRLEVLRFVGGG